MTERQKVLFSIAGALVLHLLLLLALTIFLPIANALTPTLPKPAPPDEPEEITILLEDVIPEPEPEPEFEQQYARTFPDQESDIQPENAPFHSDRNTLAASELPPDPNGEKFLPTVDGMKEVPWIELRDQDFQDGDFSDRPMAAPSQPSPPMTPQMRPPSITPDSIFANTDPSPADKPSPEESQDQPDKPVEEQGEADKQPENPSQEKPLENITDSAEKLILPSPDETGPAQMEEFKETIEEGRDDPDGPQVGRKTAEEDMASRAEKETEEIGRPAQPDPAPKRVRIGPISASALSPAANMPQPPLPQPSEKPAFMTETRASSVSGSISNKGSRALNVENNALGRYKKALAQAFERQWHRYRMDNAGSVEFGNIKIRFRVDRQGYPRNLEIIRSSEGATVMKDFSLRAVQDADYPPMPAEIAAEYGASGLEITYDIIIY